MAPCKPVTRTILHGLLTSFLVLPAVCYLQRYRPHTPRPTQSRCASATTTQPSSDEEPKQNQFTSFESPMYDERRPRRESRHHDHQASPWPAADHRWNDWGIQHQPSVAFPSTIDRVADAAADAIAGTIYGQTKNDPNLVQNVLAGETLWGRRPVRQTSDAGRIGVEMDAVREIAASTTEASALRHFSLLLASKLSQHPWKSVEIASNKVQGRPVAIYFNTVRQALFASQELYSLKQMDVTDHLFGNVTIHCLGSDTNLPAELTDHANNIDRIRKGQIDPARGLVLVVQPTDYNDEYRPPGPSLGTVEALQQLAARSSVEQVPMVVLSPRFAKLESPCFSWEQSGYQQSSAYGGLEPPRGPTPWIMRDFTPPVFSWIRRALTLPNNYLFSNEQGAPCQYTSIALLQSVMLEGHSWHLFAVKECKAAEQIDYEYLASTKSATGRPTKEVMLRIFSEFASFQ